MECYYKWLEEGEMPETGLCSSLPFDLIDTDAFFMMEPTEKDYDKIAKRKEAQIFWASGVKYDDPKRRYTFTPLRQTIVILCALMEGERFNR